MIQQIVDHLPGFANRIQAPVALGIAGVGLLIGLVGARFSRLILSLTLVSVGTVVGLHLPKWFGWGIDPMGTAFGSAIVLGVAGYVMTIFWEGVFLASLLAGITGTAVWMSLAPHDAWHLPAIDWSQTAVEIAAKIRLSLPAALTTALPVAGGIALAIGALVMIVVPRLGRSLLYCVLGMGVAVSAGLLGVHQLRPEWLDRIPQDATIQAGILGILLLVSVAIQWLLSPRPIIVTEAATSENKLQLNQFVAKGPAMLVHAAESRVLMPGVAKHSTGPREQFASSRIR